MPITYTGDLGTNLDKVRFYVGDTVDGSGVKPGDGNFSDAELNGLISTEGSWQGAVAAAYEILEALYANQADIRIGDAQEKLSQTADRYGKLAGKWRRRHGTTGGGAGSRAVTRVDGYSSDIASDAT